MNRKMCSIDCVGFLVSAYLVLSTPSNSGWKCFRWLTSLPDSFALERLECSCLIKMDYGVKLIGKSRVEVVALSFGLRQIDHTDCTFESRFAQGRCRWSIFQGKQKVAERLLVKQIFITV